MNKFLALFFFMLLGMSTSTASIYEGSFKQSEFRYVKTIERSTCANAYRPFRTKIVAPSGWYFEIAPDRICSFRLTQVKRKKNSRDKSDELYLHVMPNDPDQENLPVEKIRERMNTAGLDVDLVEISSYGERNSISSRSFLETDQRKLVTRLDEFRANGFDFFVLETSANSVQKLNTTSKVYTHLVEAIMGKGDAHDLRQR